MTTPLHILVLHGLPIGEETFSGVRDIELAFPRYDSRNNYLVHNVHLPVPKWLKEFPFDAIFLTSTAIDRTGTRAGLTSLNKNLNFLRNSKSVKIGFPQDDYWCSETRDIWYTQNRFDLIYPVCPEETWEMLVPNFLRQARDVRRGYATYITPKLRDLASSWPEHRNRNLDVIYRAKGKPAFPNTLGRLKATIGETFNQAIGTIDLKIDISTNASDLIQGDRWFDFLKSSRATLTTPSGSSLRVRNNLIAQSLLKLPRSEKITQQILAKCGITEADLSVDYIGISPRLLEAAASRTTQLMVTGASDGFLRAGIDYMQLDQDCRNAAELAESLLNHQLTEEIAESCWTRLLSFNELAIETHIDQTLDYVSSKSLGIDRSSTPNFKELLVRHQKYVNRLTHLLKPREASLSYLRRNAPEFAVRRARRLLGR